LSEHLCQTQIVNFGRRPLPPAEWLSVTDHLAVCELCRLQVEDVVGNEVTYLALKSLVFDEAEASIAVAEGLHLTFEQMAGFVDESIARGKLHVVKEHLAWCEECESAVEDLRTFKKQVVVELERKGRRKSMRGKVSRWPRLIAALASMRPKSPVLALGSALAIIFLAVGWLAWQELPGMKIKPEVAGTGPTPVSSPSVVPSPVPVIIAQLNDGVGRITLDAKGKLSGVDQLPAAYQQMVKKALTEQRIERSEFVAQSSQPGLRSRGGSGISREKFSVIEPVGEVILTDRPTFRWTQLEGAMGYIVEIYDEGFNRLVSSPQLSANSWSVPEAIKRGGSYYWQVKAIKQGQEFKAPRPPAPQARFRILEEAAADELAKARRSYASSHLTLGLLYARAGMLDEAEEEFKALLKNNPDSALAQRLLRQIREKP
jgi:hypothetical protein